MNTIFSLLDKSFELTRFPEQLQHESWQAWDAADEYLIEHVENTLSFETVSRIAIFNDDFGALACWFATRITAKGNPVDIDWYSDSYVSRKSCERNLEHNMALSQPHPHPVEFRDCMTLGDQQPDVILLKIPKTTALLEHQLILLQQVVTPDTLIIAAGKVKSIQKSTLGLFEKYLGDTTTSLAKKKARLIFCRRAGDKQHTSPFPTVWQTDDKRLTIHNHANVFARQQLDIGGRLLMNHLPDCRSKRVVDLGCGNGVIGLSVLLDYPDAEVFFVDESHMAIQSAMENVKYNMPERLSQCHFIHSNCLDEFASIGHPSVDIVLCNPPFHQQNAITDHIAWQMFVDAKKYLRRGGQLRIIGNRHLDYPKKLKRLFGGYGVVTSDKKFSILSSLKR
ncbi:methyltransferase [Aestuariibacter sp. AA17]|uniref:Ribosomal RNA large subunit methyltransferase G n=1 Tax=Fluctibacter corallii TaxID=2984329 RepID=A0ABT3A4P2_9ALTE|nr:methyltransferase [Aestuariibacter sp. AA17]MCV2883573.1 methyltransferase [Aestuariibacter sp. AA17]